MHFLSPLLLSLPLLSTFSLAAPSQFLTNNGGAAKAALDWTAGSISKIGAKDDGGMHTATRWSWADCGAPEDVITLKSLTVSPDPPKPGHNLTIYASGTVHELIDVRPLPPLLAPLSRSSAKTELQEGSYADVVVKLGLIKLLTKRFDVCEELANGNATLQCPIKPDEYSIVQTVELPEEIPRAKFSVSAQAFTQTDAPMMCAVIEINFLLPDPPM